MSVILAIRRLFTLGPYYVRIRRNLLSVRDTSSGNQWSGEPLVGIEEGPNGKKTAKAFGNEARVGQYIRVNPFDHPRSIIKDFYVAELLLGHAFRQVSKNRFFKPAPIAVIQVLEPLEGGLSQIELRALREMTESAGARAVYIWDSRELTDAEIQDGIYGQSEI